MTNNDLKLRARKILQAVVSEYLQTGQAVGSRRVTRRHGISLSPATVRNEMVDLEELGLLEQPHTSAGRIPTESGLRFFIDSLLKVRSLTPKEKSEIRARLGVESEDMEEILQKTSRMLSEITPYAGIVMSPQPMLRRLRQIEFVPLRSGQCLCVLVNSDGTIENRLFELIEEIDSRQLSRIHDYLNQLLVGQTLGEMRRVVLKSLGAEKNLYDNLVSQALRLGQAALNTPDPEASVVVSGSANLLESSGIGDEEEMQRMRELLQALEDKETMVNLLDAAMNGAGLQVLLGPEMAFSGLGKSSVIATPYGNDDQPIGVIAVIGPMRMNYGKVMSIVDFTADLVSGLVANE